MEAFLLPESLPRGGNDNATWQYVRMVAVTEAELDSFIRSELFTQSEASSATSFAWLSFRAA
jgi:hypothetical protein